MWGSYGSARECVCVRRCDWWSLGVARCMSVSRRQVYLVAVAAGGAAAAAASCFSFWSK